MGMNKKTTSKNIKKKFKSLVSCFKRWRIALRTLGFDLFSKRDIVIGPWMGEVGPELLYWIPFLQNISNHGVFKNRKIFAISRGGVENWYYNITREYLEIFDYIDTGSYNEIRKERTGEKQKFITKGERNLVQKICEKNNIAKYKIIHPSLMWKKILPYLQSKKSTGNILETLSFVKFPEIVDSNSSKIVDSLKLPPEFIFIRFYSSYLLGKSKQTKYNIDNIIKILSRKFPIVSYDLGKVIDNHGSINIDNDRLINISNSIRLKNNLGVQTEIIRRSKGFWGTYGGLSILPGFIGKNSFSFYANNLNTFFDLHFRHEALTVKFYQDNGLNYQVCTLDNMEYLFKTFNE